MATEGFTAGMMDLLGALKPMAVRRLEREIEERVAKIPTSLNEYGFDPYGFHPDWIRRLMLPSALIYRYYVRAESHDIHHIPEGRVLLIANHAGQLPLDGAMLAAATILDADPPRLARSMAEYWVPTLPWISVAAMRMGVLVGTRENCISMLKAGECAVAFPEGVRGLNKPFSERYRLQRFGLGFMRLALATDTPIVPVAIVGSEEQQIGLVDGTRAGRLLGMPALPITATFPWLGPLGLLPLPVKYHIYFGEPMRFRGDPNEDDATVEEKVEVVKSSITAMFARGLRERDGVFR